MSNILSVVNIIPDAYLATINMVASLYGCGDNSLSVKLVGIDGSVFWGCHSWWTPEAYAEFTDDDRRSAFIDSYCTPDVAAAVREALTHLYECIVVNGDAQANWLSSLSDLGLSVVVDDQV